MTRPRTPHLVASLVAVLLALHGSPLAMAQQPSPPPREIHVIMFATSVDGAPMFVVNGTPSNEIFVGSTPAILNVTIINNDPVEQLHTFTIDDAQGAHIVNVELERPSGSVEVVNRTRLLVASATEIALLDGTTSLENATPTRAETVTDARGRGIHFYCIPHEAAGMIGVIRAEALAAGPATYPGFQLWAFWIGVIAMMAMIAFIGITYVVIKTSSRHHTDEREHIRRGLP